MFTTQQQEFASAIEQFCEKHCATAQQREALTDGGRLSNSPQILRQFAELGWLGVSLPIEYGGGGAGMVEECIFLEETARGLAPISTAPSPGPPAQSSSTTASAAAQVRVCMSRSRFTIKWWKVSRSRPGKLKWAPVLTLRRRWVLSFPRNR